MREFEDATLRKERQIDGTANQITITDTGANGRLNIGTSQDISTASTPQFTRMGLGQAADGSAILTIKGASAVSLDPYGASAGNTSEIRFKELVANGLNYAGIKASDSIAANLTWTIPAADGTVGQALLTGGDGILRFGSAGAPTDATYLVTQLNGSLSTERSVSGAANQITITDNGANGIFLIGTSQDIATGSSPTFSALTLTNSLTVVNGGTGAASLTDGGVLFGSGTGAVTPSAVLANGEMLIGDGTTDPAVARIATTANQTSISYGAGTVTIGTSQDIATASTPQFARMGLGTAADAGTILTLTGGTLPTTENVINITGTLADAAATERGVYLAITTAGTAQSPRGLVVDLNAGYTGTNSSHAIAGSNNVLGTAAGDPFNDEQAANYGAEYNVLGTTVGTNAGFRGVARNGNKNFGLEGIVNTSKSGSKNVGVMGWSTAAVGAGGTANGGIFMIGAAATPSYTESAILCDNRAIAAPIAVFRDNGTEQIRIEDGGGLNVKQTIGIAVSPDSGALITTRGQVGVSLDNYGASAGNTGEIRFKELAATGQNYVALKASDDIGATKTYVIPAADGSAGQILSTGGDGILRWITDSTGTTSGWTDDGTVIRLDTSTDDVVIGGTASLGHFGVLGNADEVQALIRGNGTQTAATFAVENPSAVRVFTVYAAPSMTGANNLSAGINAGDSITTGASNVLFGTNAGTGITSGANNTFFGYNAGGSTSYNSNSNTFLGYNAGAATTTGASLIFIGVSAGDSGTTFNNNVFIGDSAGTASTADGNVYIGSNAAAANTSGSGNVCIGSAVGGAFSSYTNDVLIGQGAGSLLTTGGGNIIIGQDAGDTITTGGSNICLGQSSGTNLTTGSNFFIAGDAVSAITNVFFGEGMRDGTPLAYTIHGTGGSGTDVAGANIGINGGQGTGTGAGGSIILRVAPAGGSTGSGGNTSVDVLTIKPTRNILVNTSSDFIGVTQLFVPDDGTGINVSIDAVQASITTADTFISFDSKTGEEGSIAGTGSAGVIAYNTFTGSHWSKIDDKEDIQDSMVLVATGEKWHSKQQLVKSAISTKAKDIRVYGVYGGTNKDGYDFVLALGTAFIWVTPTNGDIQVGDYLESSNVRGHAQRQDEPMLLNSTVAKALEPVQWIPGEKRRKIACTLHAG